MTQIFIHPAVCDGAGTCNRIAPQYFQLGTDGKSYIKVQPTDDTDLKLLQDAESACPFGAIVLLD